MAATVVLIGTLDTKGAAGTGAGLASLSDRGAAVGAMACTTRP